LKFGALGLGGAPIVALQTSCPILLGFGEGAVLAQGYGDLGGVAEPRQSARLHLLVPSQWKRKEEWVHGRRRVASGEKAVNEEEDREMGRENRRITGTPD